MYPAGSLVKLHPTQPRYGNMPYDMHRRKGGADRVYQVQYDRGDQRLVCHLWDTVKNKRLGYHYYRIYKEDLLPLDFFLKTNLEDWL